MHALRSALAVLAVLAVPAAATARPFTAGVSAGAAQSKVDADRDANRTIGLFGRVGLTRRLGAQLELSKVQLDPETNDDGTTIRKLTALLVVELRDRGRLMPMLLVGMGVDRASTAWSETSGDHIEGGFGVEYRAGNGLAIGLDLRMGGRSIDEDFGTVRDVGAVARDAPSHLAEGEYRTARVTLGLRF